MARKKVRALRTGFWEGHRRRTGAEFTVDAKASEKWFVEIGAASADDAPPPQLQDARSAPKKTFVGAMDSIAKAESAKAAVLSKPLSKPLSEVEAPAVVPDVSVGSDGADLT